MNDTKHGHRINNIVLNFTFLIKLIKFKRVLNNFASIKSFCSIHSLLVIDNGHDSFTFAYTQLGMFGYSRGIKNNDIVIAIKITHLAIKLN